ncbi:MAG: hypothetical protein RDU30_07220 [Desulfovibrionaceae bacterium]|nr:hypothetical protein [Desulfovibrionaceae bacterium]
MSEVIFTARFLVRMACFPLASILMLMCFTFSVHAQSEEPPVFGGKWGTNGTADGQFSRPEAVAVAADGSVYVADSGNNRIQKFSADGVFLTKWGSQGTGDGQFDVPVSVAVAPDGSLYVGESGNKRIQKFSSDGTFLTRWGPEGEFGRFFTIAVAMDGSVYVADTLNNRIKKYSSDGVFLTEWGQGFDPEGNLSCPFGIAVAADGSVYVADTFNSRIQKYSSNGVFLARWGSRGVGDGQFGWPMAVAVAADGSVYVADHQFNDQKYENNRIQKFSANGTFLTKWGGYGAGDGQFYMPYDVDVASSGLVYVADYGNSRIQYFQPQSPKPRGAFQPVLFMLLE